MKKDMTSGSEGKKIFYFALPIMLSIFIQQLYGIIDGVVVGRVIGEHALEAVMVATPLMMLALAVGIGLGQGVGVVISQNYGAKQMDAVRLAASTGFKLISVIGAAVTILIFIFAPFLLETVLRVRPVILADAILYFRIFSIGFFFQFVTNAAASSMQAIGDVKMLLFFSVLASVVSVILTVLAVAVLGWGLVGAALTTVFVKALGAVIFLTYMYKKYDFLRPQRGFDRAVCRKILRVGLPVTIQHGMLSIAHIFQWSLVNEVAGAAAYGVAMRIESFAFVPIIAFANAMTTFTGQNIGAERFDRVKSGFKKTFTLSTIACAIIVLVLVIFAPIFASWFGLYNGYELIDAAYCDAGIYTPAHYIYINSLHRSVRQIRYVSPWFVLLAGGLVINGVLKGAGDVFYPMVVTGIDLSIRVALAYALFYAGVMGAQAYTAPWVTVPVGWLLFFGAAVWRLHSRRWKYKRLVGA